MEIGLLRPLRLYADFLADHVLAYCRARNPDPEAPGRRAPVLLYHKIAAGAPDPWTVAPEEFVRQMIDLARSGYRTVEPGDLLRPETLPEKPLVITFDDAHRGLLVHAEPALARAGFRATAYLPTAWVRPEPDPAGEFLCREEVQGMHGRGIIRFGAHGHGHVRLDLAKDPGGDLARCLESFEAMLGARPEDFSYPFGVLTPKVRRLVERAGFRTAVTARDRVVCLSRRPDPLAIPRVCVPGGGLRLEAAAEPGGAVRVVYGGPPRFVNVCLRREGEASARRWIAFVRLKNGETRLFPKPAPQPGETPEVWDKHRVIFYGS